MKLLVKTYRPPPPAFAAAIALPRFRIAWFPERVQIRRWVAVVGIAAAFLAALVYIAAVNAMLLAGEEMKSGERELAALEQQRALLRVRMAERQSPAWLEASARLGGMLDAADIRYLSIDRVARSR